MKTGRAPRGRAGGEPRIRFAASVAEALAGKERVALLAPRALLQAGLWRKVFRGSWTAVLPRMIEDTDPSFLGRCATTYPRRGPRRVVLGVLPDLVSRHAPRSRSHAVHECCSKADLRGKAAAVVVHVADAGCWVAAANAVGRVFRLYARKSHPRPQPEVAFLAIDDRGRPVPPPVGATSTVEAARWAAAMVDRPTSEMGPDEFVREARRLVPEARATVLTGQRLLRAGLRGIHAVGRGAAVAPRLLVLAWGPRRPRRTIALVGKGIVFDTGGLHLKPRGSMEGMKSDMGGGAAVVGALRVLVGQGLPARLVCLVPLAENAIGPHSLRPDEIIVLHSGKTVEVNNTDAEGRLLLADAVSYAVRSYRPDLVVDAATLTGAQAVATGKRHAAVVASRDGLEALAVRAGRASGDLVHPLPFAPELFQGEFKSEVADMTNSVKDRNNAQPSCAAQFVWSHIAEADPPWIHIDLAGPAHVGELGTGFGVALIAEIVRSVRDADLRA